MPQNRDEDEKVELSPVVTNHSPAFEPTPEEHPLTRLGKNILQSVLNAIGWQLYTYTRRVDVFPPDKDK